MLLSFRLDVSREQPVASWLTSDYWRTVFFLSIVGVATKTGYLLLLVYWSEKYHLLCFGSAILPLSIRSSIHLALDHARKTTRWTFVEEVISIWSHISILKSNPIWGEIVRHHAHENIVLFIQLALSSSVWNKQKSPKPARIFTKTLPS